MEQHVNIVGKRSYDDPEWISEKKIRGLEFWRSLSVYDRKRIVFKEEESAVSSIGKFYLSENEAEHKCIYHEENGNFGSEWDEFFSKLDFIEKCKTLPVMSPLDLQLMLREHPKCQEAIAEALIRLLGK